MTSLGHVIQSHSPPPRLTFFQRHTSVPFPNDDFTVHFIKADRGSRGLAPLILNLGTRWRRMVNFTPRLLYPRERTPVPTEGSVDHSAGVDVLNKRTIPCPYRDANPRQLYRRRYPTTPFLTPIKTRNAWCLSIPPTLKFPATPIIDSPPIYRIKHSYDCQKNTTIIPQTNTPFPCQIRTATTGRLQLLWLRINSKLGSSTTSCTSVTDANQTAVLVYFLQFRINFILIIAPTGILAATTASSLLKNAQTGFEGPTSLLFNVHQGLFPSREWDLNRPECKADHSPSSSAGRYHTPPQQSQGQPYRACCYSFRLFQSDFPPCVWATASYFIFQYPLFSLNSSSCLRLLPRPLLTSILPSIFPSTTRF